jgi:hypothetical protein
MLNKTVSLSLKFNQLPDDTCRLLATWLIAHLDPHGVFYADAGVVRSVVFPRRTDVSPVQIDNYLNAMAEVGLIRIFEARDQPWMCWPGFSANQPGLRPERETSDFPTPLAIESRQDCGATPASLQHLAGSIPAEDEAEHEAQHEHEGESESEPISIFTDATVADILSLFGAARLTPHQARALHRLHDAHPDVFHEAVRWAANKAMSIGDAIAALRTALPNWRSHTAAGSPGTPQPNWYTEEEYERYFLHPNADKES